MNKKVVWLVVTGWMVAALLLASCAPAVVKEEAEKVAPPVKEKEEVVVPKEVVPVKGVGPQYGGRLTISTRNEPTTLWHTSSWLSYWADVQQRIHTDDLMYPNPAYGPWGNGERSGLIPYTPERHQLIGGIAESMEIDIAKERLLFKIRKGIYWQDKRAFGLPPTPVDGKELTPADVVFSYRLTWGHKPSRYPTSYAFIRDSRTLEGIKASIYLDPADPTGRTVVFEAAPGRLKDLYDRVAAYTPVWWGEAYGPLEKAITGEGYGDWRGVVGTGPMVLVDAVAASSFTYKRNPNYWMEDPRYPGNQLPYLDEMKWLIIPDLSTQMAALRTGKIDILTDLSIEDGLSLLRTNPELKSVIAQDHGLALYMRQDKAPFNDVRVRQAMMLAINHQEIVDDYYDGYATLGWYPAMPVPEYAAYGIPLAEMPRDVQMLWEYHPDKAKQLLAEAGYPKGFKTEVIVNSAESGDADLALIVKEYWAKVGVELVISMKDSAVFRTMDIRRSYEYGEFSNLPMHNILPKFNDLRVGGAGNRAIVNEPWIEEFWPKVSAADFDYEKRTRLVREKAPELNRFVPEIFLPAPKKYHLWQPWVGGYYGGIEWRYNANLGDMVSMDVWLDQELKKAMGR